MCAGLCVVRASFDIGNLTETGERVVRRTQSEGCAAGGFPSGLGWEVRLGCLRVVAGLDRHSHESLHVYTLDIIKNKIKQLVAVVVLVGASPVVYYSSCDPCHYDTCTHS